MIQKRYHNVFTVYQLITERDRLNKDLETQHAQIKQLESELDKLYQQVGRSGTVRR